VSNRLSLNETCRFKLEPREEQVIILEELFRAYSEIIKACLDKAMSLGVTSRRRLHEAVYRELRARYPAYPSHYIYTAITQALAMYKSYRRLSRKRKNVSPPRAENPAILLDDTHLFWFRWGSLKLATHKGHVIISFKVHEHSRKFVSWQVKGSRLVQRNGNFFLHVTFRKEVEEKEPEGVLGIDVNERSIDLAVVKSNKVKFIKIDISESKYIRDRYFKKRRRVQRKTRGEKRDKLLEKYSERERRRVNEILHKASKIIACIIAEENVKPVMERLINIRKRIKCGRRMNRRLHSMPFRKIQLYISYKSMEHGFKPEFVSAKNTSRRCPICGELNKPNGHFFRCRCGFQADRHFVAAWNIALKLSMCRPLPLAAKALDDPLIVEVRGKG